MEEKSPASKRDITPDFRRIQIEEKITDINGYEQVQIYTRGKFLGKGGFATVWELSKNGTG